MYVRKQHRLASPWTVVICLSFCSFPAVGQKASRSLEMVAFQGSKISSTRAAEIEGVLADDPSDAPARAQLLGYYSRRQYRSQVAQTAHQRHVLWVIEHKPASALGGLHFLELDATLNAEAYLKAKTLWLGHLERNKNSTLLLSNAATFFLLDDRVTCERLLKQGQALEPDSPEWPERLGRLHELTSRGLLGTNVAGARKALSAYEQSLELLRDPVKRYNLLNDVAMVAADAKEWESARKYATELLELTVETPVSWNYGNAVHHGNLVLGRVALASGNLEEAEQFLIKAGKTPGSPQLNSFGPNMNLALELLKRSRTDAVIEYLRLCGKFWKKNQTDQWIATIESGGTPSFGANLRY